MVDDTDTVFDLTTSSKELLLNYVQDVNNDMIGVYRILDTEISYIIKLIKNDLQEFV